MDGTAKSTKLKRLNQLRNRYTVPQDNEFDLAITPIVILAPGDERTPWSATSGAEVTGFVLGVKPGGEKHRFGCGEVYGVRPTRCTKSAKRESA